MGDATPVADSAVHGELAQANLLRLRGDLDGSEKALLGILRRFPNDPHAHEMLGDVCAERGEPERAIEWYELALDLSPNSPDIKKKLDEERERLTSRDTADTAETLGLPPSSPPAAWWPLAAGGALLLLAIIVAAWPRPRSPLPLKTTIVAPAPSNPAGSEEPAVTPPVTDPSTAVTTPPATIAAVVEEDRQLLTSLQGRTEGSRVQSVVLDPRTQAVTVTYNVTETDDAKAIAIVLGREAMAAAPAATTVTLRAVQAGRLIFAADLPRANMNAPEPLANVWPSSTTGEATPPPATTDAPTTSAMPSGTAAPGSATSPTTGP